MTSSALRAELHKQITMFSSFLLIVTFFFIIPLYHLYAVYIYIYIFWKTKKKNKKKNKKKRNGQCVHIHTYVHTYAYHGNRSLIQSLALMRFANVIKYPPEQEGVRVVFRITRIRVRE